MKAAVRIRENRAASSKKLSRTSREQAIVEKMQFCDYLDGENAYLEVSISVIQ